MTERLCQRQAVDPQDRFEKSFWGVEGGGDGVFGLLWGRRERHGRVLSGGSQKRPLEGAAVPEDSPYFAR